MANDKTIEPINNIATSSTHTGSELQDFQSKIKLIEKKLQSSQKKYQNLVDNALVGIYQTDIEGNILFANKALYEMLGFKSEKEMRADGALARYVNPKDRDRFIELLNKNGKIGNFKADIYTKNNQVLNVLVSAELSGSTISGMVRDVSELKKAEQILVDSEEKYRTLAETAHDSIFILNREGFIQYVNSFAAKQFHKKPLQIIGENIKNLFPEQASKHQMENIQKVFKIGKPLYVENKTDFPEGESWLGTWLVPLKKDTSEVYAVQGVSRDITAQKEVENVLREREHVLAEAQRISNFGSWKFNFKTNELFWSEQTYKIYGVSPGKFKLTQESFLNLIVPEDRSLMENWIRQTIEGKKVSALEFRVKTSNDEVRTLLGTGEAFFSDRNEPSHIVGTVYDTTERKQAEENQKQSIGKLKRQNKRLAALNIISSQLGLTDDDLNETLKKSLHIVLNTLGFDGGSAQLFIDGKLSRVLAQEGLSEKVVNWANSVLVDSINNKLDKKWVAGQAILSKRTVFVEDAAKFYKGEIKKLLLGEGFVSIAIIPLLNKEECLGFIMIKSESKKQEQLFELDFLDMIGKQIGMAVANSLLTSKIVNAKRDWETTFDSISDPITIHDKDFNIIRANQATAKFLNIPMDKIIGEKCYKLFHGLDEPVQGCPSKVTMKFWDDASLTLDDLKSKKSISISTSSIVENNELKNIIHIVKDVTVQKATAKSLLEATENERKDISEEIHDSMLQLLYGASIYCRKAIKSNCCDSDYLHEAIKLIEESMDAGRRLITGIRPPMLENLGLAHSLRDYANNLFKGTEVNLEMQFEKKLKKSDIDVVVYRIAQEILMNVYKHSGAENVKMKLFELSSELFLTVKDDGIGFKPDKNFFKEKTMSGHIGLQSIIEKTEMYGGQCLITSKPERGTKIEIIIPKPLM